MYKIMYYSCINLVISIEAFIRNRSRIIAFYNSFC